MESITRLSNYLNTFRAYTKSGACSTDARTLRNHKDSGSACKELPRQILHEGCDDYCLANFTSRVNSMLMSTERNNSQSILETEQTYQP
jgi:hypothetical protein